MVLICSFTCIYIYFLATNYYIRFILIRSNFTPYTDPGVFDPHRPRPGGFNAAQERQHRGVPSDRAVQI